jgi:hypothetical protein
MASLAVQQAEQGGGGGVSASKPKKTANMARLHSLYDDAKLRKERMETRRKQKSQTGLTFRPEKFSKPLKKRRGKGSTDDSDGATTLSRATNRFERLHIQATMSQKKKKATIAARPRNCTFQPKLSTKGSRYKSKIKGSPGERLFSQATASQRRKKEREKMEGLRGCTFTPKLNKKVAKSRNRLYDPDSLKKKQMQLEQRKMENEVRDCTFSPVLDTKSEKMAQKNSVSGVYARLYSTAKANEKKLDEKRKALVDNTMAECTFSPAISKPSSGKQKKEQSDAAVEDTTPASERLYNQGVAMLERRKKTEEEEKNIGPIKSKVVTSEGEQLKFFNRLYESGVAKTKKRLAAPDYKSLANSRLEDQGLRECTFSPSQVSKAPPGTMQRRKSVVPVSPKPRFPRPNSPQAASSDTSPMVESSSSHSKNIVSPKAKKSPGSSHGTSALVPTNLGEAIEVSAQNGSPASSPGNSR